MTNWTELIDPDPPNWIAEADHWKGVARRQREHLEALADRLAAGDNPQRWSIAGRIRDALYLAEFEEVRR